MKAIYEEITKRVERYLCKEYKVKLNYSDGESYLYITDKSGKLKNIFNLDSLYKGVLVLDINKLTDIILYVVVGK